MGQDRGFIYAATGDRYVTLARRSARRLKAIMPEAQVDFFTDEELDDPVFDRVHRLTSSGIRPKMEALRRSRFRQSVYLDSDTIVMHPVWDIFDLLSRFDIVAAHENYRNSPSSNMTWQGPVPPAFPEVNTGVLGLRTSAATAELMRDWEEGWANSELTKDQPILRRLLFDSPLRLGILPLDYNLMHPRLMVPMGAQMSAPRILHITRMHRADSEVGDPMEPLDPYRWLSPHVIRAYEALTQTDKTLSAPAPDLSQTSQPWYLRLARWRKRIGL